ncbi:MAG: 2-oxo acid dehydrogenase subunit E2 [Verrucomicrobiales bacterium]|nr:2-oxo acid dehydrogenase subunit E2 [Verrucomicrobiales bacterium]
MDVKLPKLGEGADSGVVVSVFVKAGDTIKKEQAILELENEKAVASIPSPAAGTISQVFVKPGDKVSVGQRLVALDSGSGGATAPATEETRPAEPKSAPTAKARPARTAKSEPEPEPASEPAEDAEPAEVEEDEAAPVSAHPPAASPSLRRLAKDLGIDLARVRGSERGGRIVMADLRSYIQRLQRLAAQAGRGDRRPARPRAEAVDFSQWGPVSVKPLSPLRQTIARRMAESWETVPRVTQFDEADVTRLGELRKQHLEAYQQKGTKLTLTPFVIKAVANTLLKHPTLNASLDPSGESLVLKSYYHLGLAVDTEAGLMVPVIRDADKKALVELSREIEALAQKARERKLTAEDMKGGTFTISNQGGIGGAHFTPILNLPEVAILGVGRGAVKPVWREGRVEPRTLMPLALSYDHRVIDGGTAARFITDLVKELEQFAESLVKL